MKILSFSRSAYESVVIQNNRNHHILNSKSEFNRCSLPRLTVKLWDREIYELARVNDVELKEEEELEKIIKEIKRQSKKRKTPVMEENPKDKPMAKRPRLGNQTCTVGSMQQPGAEDGHGHGSREVVTTTLHHGALVSGCEQQSRAVNGYKELVTTTMHHETLVSESVKQSRAEDGYKETATVLQC